MAWPEDPSEPEYGNPPFDSCPAGQEWIDACERALKKLADATDLPKGEGPPEYDELAPMLFRMLPPED